MISYITLATIIFAAINIKYHIARSNQWKMRIDADLLAIKRALNISERFSNETTKDLESVRNE